MRYANLHTHSDYSNLRLVDSINKVGNLINTAHDLELTAVALTDHECLSGHLKAIEYLEQRKRENPEDASWQDFKLILGNEIYLCRNGLDKDTVEKGEKYPHFILIALDNEGHQQLRKLSSRAWERSFTMFMKRVPTWYSDIEEVIGSNPGHVVATSACFLPGQQIKTSEGYKNIENITSDDVVYNKFGEWEKVNYPTSRDYEGEGYLLYRQGDLEPIRCTSNHKFLVSSNSYRKWTKTKDSLLQWKTAAEIVTQTGGTKDYGVRPLNTHFSNHNTIKKEEYQYSLFPKNGKRKTGTPDTIVLTPEIMRLFGLWIGDGHIDCGRNPRVGFTFNIKEFPHYYQSFIRQALEDMGGNWLIEEREKNNRVDVSCSSLDVYELFAHLFGKRHANDKTIPNRLKHISKEFDYNLLFGYLLADGYFRKRENGGECVSASISKRLTKDYIEMWNGLGVVVSVYSQPESVDKNGVRHQESFYTSIASPAFVNNIKQTVSTNAEINTLFENIIATQKHNRLRDKNGIEYLKVRFGRKEKISISEKVYCLNNDTHSFCCENMIVHNCIGNQIGIWFTQGQTDKVEEHLIWCKKIFGKDNFYLEMAPALYEEQMAYNKYLIELSNKYDIPLTIATDAHYGRPEDFQTHEIFLKSKEEDRETVDFYKYTYIMHSSEIYELMNYIDKDIITQALENTNKISNRVKGYSLYREQVIPKLPDERHAIGFEDKLLSSRVNPKYTYINKYMTSEYEDDRFGVFLTLQALKERQLTGHNLVRHLERIEMELEEMWIVSDKIHQRLMSYFLTIRTIINRIWSEVDSMTGAGRGSGPASLVCCLLGICDGDPLEQGFDLWFYRFIHRERAELADWDFDAEASKRGAIFNMVNRLCRETGGDSVGICTFGTEGARSALLTACRGMGLSSDTGQYLSSLIGQNRGFNHSLEDTYHGNKSKDILPSRDFKREIDKYPGLFNTACAISGLITRMGQHAAGILLYNDSIFEYNALMKTPGGARVSQYDLGDSEKMGSIKYDFLSVDALDKIHVCMDLLIKDNLIEDKGTLRDKYNKNLHPDVLERHAPEMWKMLNEGKIVSAFQMDSITAKQTLASIHPSSLLELAAVNSLMRLVPEKGHKSPAEDYLEYKLNPGKLKAEVDALKGTDEEKKILYEYLKKYNGVLESQENMMQVTMIPEFTNFTFSEASKLRKIVAKKKLKDVDSFREFFIRKGLDNGCSEDILKYIWDVQIKRQLG